MARHSEAHFEPGSGRAFINPRFWRGTEGVESAGHERSETHVRYIPHSLAAVIEAKEDLPAQARALSGLSVKHESNAMRVVAV